MSAMISKVQFYSPEIPQLPPVALNPMDLAKILKHLGYHPEFQGHLNHKALLKHFLQALVKVKRELPQDPHVSSAVDALLNLTEQVSQNPASTLKWQMVPS